MTYKAQEKTTKRSPGLPRVPLYVAPQGITLRVFGVEERKKERKKAKNCGELRGIVMVIKSTSVRDKERARTEEYPVLFSTLSQIFCSVFQGLAITCSVVIPIVQLEFRKVC